MFLFFIIYYYFYTTKVFRYLWIFDRVYVVPSLTLTRLLQVGILWKWLQDTGKFSNLVSHWYHEALRNTKSTHWGSKTHVLNCVCYFVKLKIINIFSVCLTWIIFTNLFYYLAYFCYCSWVSLYYFG